MKKCLFLTAIMFSALLGYSQGDPFINGTAFLQNLIAVNQTTTLTVSFGNAPNIDIPVDPDPTENVKVNISLAGNYYMASPANSASITGTAAALFSWVVNPATGVLTGTQIAAIPGRFLGDIVVVIKATQQSGGTPQTTGVLIQVPAGDNGANNSGTASLTVTVPLAVAFTDIAAKKTGCEVKVTWANSLESNLDKYELESSRNGRDFIKVGEMAATNSRNYVSQFVLNDQTSANTIYVRVKAIDKDGKVSYSSIATLYGLCTDANWEIQAYPIPVKKESFIMLSAKSGIFNGKYALTIIDKGGKQINSTEVTINSSKTHKYVLDKTLAAGKYYLKVSNKDGSQSQTLAIEIL